MNIYSSDYQYFLFYLLYKCILLKGDSVERIQKIIANSGYCSRRKAEELIKAGKVKLNGEVIRELGTKANYSDQIKVDNH